MLEGRVFTMTPIGTDGWGRPCYRCIETNKIWKDVNLGKGEMDLADADSIDGEPGFPIPNGVKVVIANKGE